MKSTASILVMLLSLTACAGAPIVDPRPAVKAPQPPPLVKEPLGPSYLGQMQNFLSGKLPGGTGIALPLPPVTKPTTPSAIH